MKNNLKKLNKKQGRPTVINRHVLSELKIAYSTDATDKEACAFAGISEKTLYNYQNKNPEFLQQKQGLKAQMILKAREVLFETLDKNANLAFRYLQRKLPQEFGSSSVKARYENNEPSELSEVIKKIKEMKIS